MATKSKFFRVATEGATTDGRTITREQIKQMADSYNQKTYGARVWVEHMRSLLPDSPFRAYGDVIAVKAEEVDTDQGKRLALFAQIEPTPALIAMNKEKQKIFTSIELADKFADTGSAYLVGLAVTDSPASLGTEILQFSANKPNASPLAARKHKPENLFSEAIEVQLEFEDDGPSLTDTVKQLFARLVGAEKKNNDQHGDAAAAVTAVAEQVASFAQTANGAAEGVADLRKKFEALEKRVNDESSNAEQFRQTVNLTDKSDSQRPPATGGKNVVETAF
ncbi:GPO family capsid scaffolding protein [Herbaspirillum robiniae]|uniref:GPO family capsid scaffolding protein n=1 Tax=Herbaspirillum robiniae TaxID=2014887 RepID=UPI0009A17C82|nr:GPO family capsid scaffolding protein [Herbaspirillum robiniae]